MKDTPLSELYARLVARSSELSRCQDCWTACRGFNQSLGKGGNARGLYTLATIHMLAHILLRYYQFLRTPSALQDALSRRAAIGRTLTATGTAPRTPGVSRFLYRLAIERFEVEATLDRWLARPVLGAARALGRAEDRIVDWIAGSPTDEGPRTGPAPAPPTSTGPAAQPGASDGRGVA